MIPILYDKTGKVKLGELVDIIDSGYVEEERNGIFEFTIDYPVGYPLSDLLVEENMIETKPNEEQGLQKFRIYDAKRLMKNVILVFARHESFDLANDHVENVNLENASCEYALNTLFRNSHFSTHYRGYSDIINAQNYKIDNINILNAIAGKEGSIIDTYGTGAEILRDGTNIHVLNKRGHDNEVTIEFGKNLTDFVLERDLTDLETRVGGFAKYTDENNKEVIVKSNWIDSPYIENFAHPYINIEGRRDYSDKFKDGEVPTVDKLNKLCEDEFKINKRDIPKSNYTIKFIPLSKCVGYEGIQDKISLCDTVRIIDKRFNVDTKAKVIKYKYDFIKERYESMELGEPRTTLGDIIGGSSGEQGPPGKDGEQGPPGQDGNVENMPDTLPNTPVLTPKVYGMGSVELSWTFENKLYYTYELYASRTKDFTPNVFDLIHAGQSSSFKFNGNPGENWYFKVCAINSHNNRTPFSNQVEVVLTKVEDMNNYFSEMAIGKAVVQSLSADYMEAGIIKANWVELKGASVIDGNGKRVFDIDSWGRMTLMPSVFKMLIDGKEENVVTENRFVSTTEKLQSSITKIEDDYVTGTEFIQSNNSFEFKIYESTSPNIFPNSSFEKEEVYTKNHPFVLDWTKGGGSTVYPPTIDGGKAILLYTNGGDSYFVKDTSIKISSNSSYIVSFYYCASHGRSGSNYIYINGNPVNIPITYIGDRAWHRHSFILNTTSNVDGITKIRLGIVAQETCWVMFDNLQIEKNNGSNLPSTYRFMQNEVCVNNSFIDGEGMGVKHEDGSYTKMLANGFRRYVGSTGYSYHYLTYIGKTQKLNMNPVTVQLPDDFKGKDFKVTLSLEEIANPAGWFIQSLQLLVGSIDKINGKFQILGGSQSQFHDGTQGTMQPTTISYTVTA